MGSRSHDRGRVGFLHPSGGAMPSVPPVFPADAHVHVTAIARMRRVGPRTMERSRIPS